MLIQYTDIGAPDQDSADKVVNNLLVGIPEFEQISCLDWRVNSVYIPDSSAYDPRAGQNNEMFNACARNGIINGLISSQRLLENLVGFSLTQQDRSQSFKWNGRASNFQTEHLGITAIGQQQVREWLQTADIQYYLETDVSTFDETDYCSVVISRALFPNPKRVLIRDSATGRNFPVDHDIMPVVYGVGNSQWKIGLRDNQAQSPCAFANEFSAQSYDFIIVDYLGDPASCEGEIVPCFRGTDQEITYQRKENLPASAGVRFWFYSWDLTDEQFANDTIDLSGTYPEFYKLVDSIDFQCVSNAPIATVATYTDSCDGVVKTSTTLVTVTVKDAANGVITIDKAAEQTLPSAEYVDVLVYYQTSPEALGRASDLASAREAIAYFTAAELKQATCGCTFNSGFIKTAQESYSKIRVNPMTGETVIDLKYGSLFGHLAFSERVKRIKISRPLFMI